MKLELDSAQVSSLLAVLDSELKRSGLKSLGTVVSLYNAVVAAEEENQENNRGTLDEVKSEKSVGSNSKRVSKKGSKRT